LPIAGRERWYIGGAPEVYWALRSGSLGGCRSTVQHPGHGRRVRKSRVDGKTFQVWLVPILGKMEGADDPFESQKWQKGAFLLNEVMETEFRST